MKKLKPYSLFTLLFLLTISQSIIAQNVVNTLAAFRIAVTNGNQQITLAAGTYNLEDLPNNSRVITFSGSNNTINLTGAHIKVPVGSIKESYMMMTGNHITIIGGEIEDIYRNGLTEITDFSAYNNDRTNLAYGLKGAAVMSILGNNNVINGLKLTVRGSFPYGYGSIYGIGRGNTFGLDTRCGILIKGKSNTRDNVNLQQRAFGHAIYMQEPADKTIIKNSYVEGILRATAEFHDEKNTYDLPYKSDYKMPFDVAGGQYDSPVAIPKDEVFTLTEDGIRVYNKGGSITVENCTVKKTRGGIRLYFSPDASVVNSTAIDCGSTNFNLPANGSIKSSTANFAYAPVSDFRMAKSNQTMEITILPTPHAKGPHNIADVQGNNHDIVFHRTSGPVNVTNRAIVVKGNNSTIINETEYPIILESEATGNIIKSRLGSKITDNGTNNKVTFLD